MIPSAKDLRKENDRLRQKLGLPPLKSNVETISVLKREAEVLLEQIRVYEYWVERLSTDEGRLEALFNLQYLTSIPLPVWAARRDAAIMHWNRYAERTYGHSSEAAMGESYLDLFVSDSDREQSQQDLVDIIDGSEGLEHFNMADDIDRHGRPIHVLTCCFPVFDPRTLELVQAEISFDTSRLEDYKDELQQQKERHKNRIHEERRYLIDTVKNFVHKRILECDRQIERTTQFVGDPKSTANERTMHEKQLDQSKKRRKELDLRQIDMIKRISNAPTEKSLQALRSDIDQWKDDDV